MTGKCIKVVKLLNKYQAMAPALIPCINQVQYEQGCAVRVRMCSTSEDVLWKSGTSLVQASRSNFGTGRHYSKILPVNILV